MPTPIRLLDLPVHGVPGLYRGHRYQCVENINSPITPETLAGHIEAIDPMTGKAVWRKPLYGEMIASAMLATGGGLLFTGKHNGDFIAVDADTGQTLWSFKTGSGVNAQPITWTKNGKQYVTVLSGIGGLPPDGAACPTFRSAARYGRSRCSTSRGES